MRVKGKREYTRHHIIKKSPIKLHEFPAFTSVLLKFQDKKICMYINTRRPATQPPEPAKEQLDYDQSKMALWELDVDSGIISVGFKIDRFSDSGSLSYFPLSIFIFTFYYIFDDILL